MKREPDEDVVAITPMPPGLLHQAKELLAFREVLWVLVWRDLQVRYRQTLVGALWILLQPLLLVAVASLVFGRIPGLANGGVPYALFAFLGLWLWGFFASALTGAAGSLVAHASVLSKVYLPPVLVPVASIATRVVDLMVGIPVLLMLMISFGRAPGPSALAAIPLLLLLVALILGLGLTAASLMAHFRDVGQALPFVLQVGLFATPVVYSADVLPEGTRALIYLNPLSGIFEGMRAALFGTPVALWAILGSVVWTLALLLVGIRLFRWAERSLVDAL